MAGPFGSAVDSTDGVARASWEFFFERFRTKTPPYAPLSRLPPASRQACVCTTLSYSSVVLVHPRVLKCTPTPDSTSQLLTEIVIFI